MKRKITPSIVSLGLLLLTACGSSSTEPSNRDRNATITTVAGAATDSNSSSLVPTSCATIQGSILTTCKPFKDYAVMWLDDTNFLSPNMGSELQTPITKLDFSKMNPSTGTTQVQVDIDFTDGTSLSGAKFPFVPIPDLTVKTTTTTKAPGIPRAVTTTTSKTATYYYSPPKTTTTSTTTTIAIVKSDCVITVQASVLTACAPIQSDTRVWWSDTKALSATGGGSSVTKKTTEDYNGIGAPPGTTRVQITLDLVDGRKIAKLFIPYGNPEKVTINAQATSIPTTTLPALKISISSQGILSAGIPIKKYSYSSWNDTKQLSGMYSTTYGSPSYEARVSGSKDSTRIRITIEFTNGKSYTNIFIPYTYGKATSILLPQ